jgi:hypothetical protein
MPESDDTTLARITRIHIGYTPNIIQDRDGGCTEAFSHRLVNYNLNMCEDISIADDFDVRLGVVSGGVSLSIRPAETNPKSADISTCTHLWIAFQTQI